jgi:hypothetical protein
MKQSVSNKNKRFKKHKKTVKICSPIVQQKTVFENTCMSIDAIQEIKKEYNKNIDKSRHINTNNPYDIWNILNERFTNCSDSSNKDVCWLNQLKNKQISKKIKEYIFVPKSPFTWVKNPNEWLSNYDILTVLKQYENAYPNFKTIDPSPIDFDTKIYNKCVTPELCDFSLSMYLKNKITKIGIVFNLDKHTGKGSHWVSLFIDIKDKFIFYFDSNGSEIPPEIIILKDRIIQQGKSHGIHFRFYNNVNNQHQKGNSECGMYSLFFIITMLTGNIQEYKKNLSLQQRINIFCKKRIPDKYVENYRQIFFRDFE